MIRPVTILALSCVMVAACAPNLREVPPVVSARSAPANTPAPQILRGAGLESVIGQRAAALTQRFGKARIDLSEGDARKLQFASQSCVLDIFLYPLAQGSVPVATHIEARRRIGGGETDRARCIDDVERSARGG